MPGPVSDSYPGPRDGAPLLPPWRDRDVLEAIIDRLPRYRYAFTGETQLHTGIADVLGREGIAFEREVIAGANRFDFLCGDDATLGAGVVIEAKIKGSFAEALTQVARYCEVPDVSAVVLVTTRTWGLAPQARGTLEFHGKPVRVVKLYGQVV